ncbi:Flagellum-specific muramidase [gamma proteobacterium HdN1]|nr:Flagellum-specific muramidase [gamma proteobacterium HdN1]
MINPTVASSTSSVLDASSLNQLREAGASGSSEQRHEALFKAAKQMESIFMDMVMKSMRQADAVFAEGNMLESQEGGVFRDMLDKEYSNKIAGSSQFGLAEQIARQLDPEYAKTHPSTVVRKARPQGNSYSISDAPTFSLLKHPPMRSANTTDSSRREDASGGVLDTSSPTAFINSILPYAKRAAKELGIDARAIVAQAALETGWGKHVMSDKQGNQSLNLFGIKAGGSWKGERAKVQTTEFRQNVAVREVAEFRSYNSLDHVFDDYVDFLKNNPRYAGALEHSGDAAQWGAHLQKAGYATDPEYGKKIARLVNSDEISWIPKG